jgi:hypothetical protein
MFHLRTHGRRLALTALCFFAAVLPASAATILLEVDVSDPSAITFASTGAAPLVSDDNSDEFDGITLSTFFDLPYDPFFDAPLDEVNGNLKAPGARSYNFVANDFDQIGVRDLNFYRDSFFSRTQRFDVNQAAFTGTGVVDLTGATFTLGRIGDIRAGARPSDPVIGQYQILGGTPIPEPVAALGGMTLLGTIVLRRRRQTV